MTTNIQDNQDDQVVQDQNPPADSSAPNNPESQEVQAPPERDDRLIATLNAIEQQAEENYQTTEDLIQDTEKLLESDQGVDAPANPEPSTPDPTQAKS